MYGIAVLIGMYRFTGYLTLSSNRFNNTLPDEMRLLTNLKEIYLDKNNFEGELQVPIAEGLGKFHLLTMKKHLIINKSDLANCYTGCLLLTFQYFSPTSNKQQ